MIKVNKNLVESYENNGYVILNMENGNFYGVYDTGKEIWDLIKDNKTEEEILYTLKEKYIEVGSEDIKNDYIEFIDRLQESGIIENYEKNI